MLSGRGKWKDLSELGTYSHKAALAGGAWAALEGASILQLTTVPNTPCCLVSGNVQHCPQLAHVSKPLGKWLTPAQPGSSGFMKLLKQLWGHM